MIFFIIFVLEFILLFFLSKRLIRALSLTIFKITKSHNAVVNTLAVIFLPGTIVHELAHLLTAGVMMVPVGDISVLPEIDPDSIGVEEKGVKLGSVQIGKVDPFRLTIVGVAPVLLGLSAILGILYFAQNASNLTWWQVVLGLYLIFEISNTMFSSKKDLEGTIGFVIAILIVSLVALGSLYFWNPGLLQSVWAFIKSQNLQAVSNFFRLGVFYLLVPLVLDFLIIFATTPLRRQ